MTERVRVRNATKFDIGLVSQTGLGYNIKAGLFITMNRDDVEYNMALAPKLFEKPAMLIVEDEDLSQSVGIEDYNKATYSEADIEKILKGTTAKLKAFVDENKEHHHIIEMLATASEKMDLPTSKVKILKEVLPFRDFVED